LNPDHASFPCGDITLEGIWHLPRTESPLPCVVVCHPHPFYGGSMSNNVVYAICRALAERNIAAFRFNFRGVEQSGGSFGDGNGEQEDVRAVLSFILESRYIDAGRIGLAGYSFGAGVALPVALQDNRISRLALVSPALSDAGWEQIKSYNKPNFIAVGDADFVIPLKQFRKHIQEIPATCRYQIIPGADHFWGEHIKLLAQKVTDFFVDGFGQPGSDCE